MTPRRVELMTTIRAALAFDVSNAPEVVAPPAIAAPPGSCEALAGQRTTRLKQGVSGRTCAAVRLLEAGANASVEVERFLLASTSRMATAGTLLDRVDWGEVAHDQFVTVDQRDLDNASFVADHTHSNNLLKAERDCASAEIVHTAFEYSAMR